MENDVLEFPPDKTTNIIAMMNGDQRYVFIYPHSARSQMFKVLEKCVNDPAWEGFSWKQAAALSRVVRENSKIATEPDEAVRLELIKSLEDWLDGKPSRRAA